jgi:hypothetical protein
VVQRGGGQRFLFETCKASGVDRVRRHRQHLECDFAMQSHVNGPIDLTHAAAAE